MMWVALEYDMDEVVRVFGPFDSEQQALEYIDKYELYFCNIFPITETP